MKRIHTTAITASLAGTILALLLLILGNYIYTPIPYIEVQAPPTPSLPVKTMLATILLTIIAVIKPPKTSPLLAAYYSYTLVGYLAWTYLHTLPLTSIILYTAAVTVPEAAVITYTILATGQGNQRAKTAIPVVMITSLLRGVIWTVKPG